MTLAVSKLSTDPDFNHEKHSSRNASPDKMLELLIDGDNDLVGLFAYSLHRQNLHDWTVAFETTYGRSPDQADLGYFELGENSQRRRLAYRKEAEWRLAQQSQDRSGSANAAQSIIQRAYLSAGRQVARSAVLRRRSQILAAIRRTTLACLFAGTAVLYGVSVSDSDQDTPILKHKSMAARGG